MAYYVSYYVKPYLSSKLLKHDAVALKHNGNSSKKEKVLS